MTASTGPSGPPAPSTGAPGGAPPVPSMEPRGTTDFANLVIHELSLTDKEKDGTKGKRWLEEPPRSLFGIALSGGGIRSSTFNLGLLQGLHEIGLLRGMDYLATVSGGGYVGGFWTRWRSNPAIPKPPDAPKVFPDGRLIGSPDHPANKNLRIGDEPAEIGHLRKFSKFLAPNVGVFTFDTGRMLVAVVNAAVPSLIGAASFLIGAMLLSIGIGGLVLASPAWLPGWGATSFGGVHVGAAIAMAAFGALHLTAMHTFWKTERPLSRRRALLVVAMVVALGLIWGLMVGLQWPSSSGPAQAREWFERAANRAYPSAGDPIWGYLLSPALALLLLSVVNAALRPRREEGVDHPLALARAEADRVSSWLLFASAAWLGVVVLWWVAFFIAANQGSLGKAISGLTIAGIPAASFVAWLSRFISQPSPSGEKRAQRAGRLSIVAVGYLALTALVVAAMLVIIWVHAEKRWPLLFVLTMAAALFTVLFYDANRIGLHEFYRARIARGFLGAGAVTGLPRDNATEAQVGDDIAISQLNCDRPLHLVVCAANDLTPRNPVESLSRGAVSAVLSPVGFSVGERWVTWCPPAASSPWRLDALPTLGAAVTASGAAFNTQMGAKSKSLGPAISFLMTSLGLRLGLWLRHPAVLASRMDAATKAAEEGSSKAETSIGVVRGGDDSPLAFYSELLGLSDARNADWVFLSDGGHFDNTALYELVRRHCRFIIVSDCGQDSDRAFDDLGMAVRRVREDFGVDIRVNLEPLKPDATGFSRQPMVAGDIHYPAGDTGTILVFKPSLVGTEPPDVLQYRARNNLFPHQSTGDQFFDEAQWESYRRLGQHVARIAFASTTERDRHPTLAGTKGQLADIVVPEILRDEMAKVFGTARREWFARPADYAQRVERIAKQVSALDSVLAVNASRLVREVQWELGTLAPQLKNGETKLADTMTLDECAKAIAAIRQAVVTFEAIFLAENLGTQFNQPMYAGVMNLMARWLRAPLVRTWWPLLKATCTQGFRKFAEAQFELGSAREDRTVTVQTPPDSVLDLASWHRPADGSLDGSDHLHLLMALKDVPEVTGMPSANSTVVEVARLDVNRSKNGKLLIWLARDLVVPPGLWGTGLGSDLLRRMGEHVAKEQRITIQDTPAEGYGQIVLVRTFPSAGANAKKDSADLQQLYTGADFEPVKHTAMQSLYNVEPDKAFDTAYEALYKRWHKGEPVLPSLDELDKGLAQFVMLHRPAKKPVTPA